VDSTSYRRMWPGGRVEVPLVTEESTDMEEFFLFFF
jgi:hypothetical protein